MNAVNDTRDSWPVLMLKCALMLAEGRSTCQRYHVGCIITDNHHGRWFVGYNGNYAGGPNNCDDPTIKGGCGCLHAEDNAIAKCDNTIGYRIAYVTAAPCKTCAKRLVNAGVREVYYSDPYTYTEGIAVLMNAGVAVTWVNPQDLAEDDDDDHEELCNCWDCER